MLSRLCVFFFFKQKAAYEMRISDWSSDVCSSDLLMVWGTTRSAVPCRNSMGVVSVASFSTEANGWVTSRLAPGSLPHFRVPSMAAILVKLDSKIGRASCRERVCQYD